MSKKDYILIAYALAHANAKASGEKSVGVAIAALELADALGRANPRFDREKFLRACEARP